MLNNACLTELLWGIGKACKSLIHLILKHLMHKNIQLILPIISV